MIIESDYYFILINLRVLATFSLNMILKTYVGKCTPIWSYLHGIQLAMFRKKRVRWHLFFLLELVFKKKTTLSCDKILSKMIGGKNCPTSLNIWGHILLIRADIQLRSSQYLFYDRTIFSCVASRSSMYIYAKYRLIDNSIKQHVTSPMQIA